MNKELFSYIKNEEQRQSKNIELIASENFPSDEVYKAMSCCFSAKYCEGYPEQESIDRFKTAHPDYKHTGNVGRYYGGCQNADMIELYGRYVWQKAFNTSYHCNLQPHSGSQANMAAYMAVLKPQDKILAMSLDAGGHLTHSSSASFVSELYQVETYGIDDNGILNYDELKNKILSFQPKLIVVGASAYSRIIDFEKIKNIIKECCEEYRLSYETTYKPFLMVDMAHIAGLVVSGDHPSPFGIADIITTTVHKTLR